MSALRLLGSNQIKIGEGKAEGNEKFSLNRPLILGVVYVSLSCKSMDFMLLENEGSVYTFFRCPSPVWFS